MLTTRTASKLRDNRTAVAVEITPSSKTPRHAAKKQTGQCRCILAVFAIEYDLLPHTPEPSVTMADL
jgi:hypothetical protein